MNIHEALKVIGQMLINMDDEDADVTIEKIGSPFTVTRYRFTNRSNVKDYDISVDDFDLETALIRFAEEVGK